MGRVREIQRLRRRVGIGAPDPSLTAVSGMALVTELVDRLNMIRLLDAAIGSIKTRNRGHTGGQLLVVMACAQLAGEDFLIGLDRQRADAAGQQLVPVPGLASTTAAGLARRLSDRQWRAVETGLGDVAAVLGLEDNPKALVAREFDGVGGAVEVSALTHALGAFQGECVRC